MIKIGYLLNLIRVRTRRLIERAAANAAADAIREAGAQGKKALEAAEAEAAPVTELFRNASGDEAVELACPAAGLRRSCPRGKEENRREDRAASNCHCSHASESFLFSFPLAKATLGTNQKHQGRAPEAHVKSKSWHLKSQSCNRFLSSAHHLVAITTCLRGWSASRSRS